MSGGTDTNAIRDLITALHKLDDTIKHLDAKSVQPTHLASGKDHEVLRDEKVPVFIRVVFLKLGEIDTVKETFISDVFIQARWREPKLDGQQDEIDVDSINWNLYWSSKLNVDNLLSDTSDVTWRQVLWSDEGEATVFEKRRIKGTFLENMELNEFPFDYQDLSVTVISGLSENEIALENDDIEISNINIQSFVDEQEWRLHSHVETWNSMKKQDFLNSKVTRQPCMTASCRAQRRAGFFVWNILIVMFFICSLSFSTFTVEINIPQNRLQLSFTLVLTTIAFKFVANQSLPKISYLTYLDKYILTSMAILCCICVWHAVVPVVETNYGFEKAEDADKVAVVLLGTAYVLFHVVFLLTIYVESKKKSRKYKMKDEEHKARMEQQMKQKKNVVQRVVPS